MLRVEISIKMDRLAELVSRSPNRLEDIRDICLELATDIDQHLQEVEEEHYDHYEEKNEDDDDGEEYDIENDERYQEYQYRYGEDDE